MNFAHFTIAVDNNEQLPYRFENMRIERRKSFVLTVSKSLDTGDYSIVGAEDKVCVERKSLADLFGTLGRGRDRFKRELERMQTFERSIVIIEATWEQMFDPGKDDPSWPSSVPPASVVGSIVAFAGEFPKTRWKVVKDRRNAEKETFKFLLNWYNNIEIDKEE